MRVPEPLRRIVLRNTVAQDTAALYFSHLAAAGLGFVVALIVARELGPVEFGIITAYTALIDLLAGFTDFGLGTGLIKFTSPHLRGQRERAFPYFRAAFYAEIVAGVFVLVAGLSLSGLVVRFVGKDLPHDVVVIAVIAAAITSTGAYVPAALAAHKRFRTSAALALGASLVRLLAVLGLLAISALSLYHVLYVYAVVAFGFAAAGLFVTPKDYRQPVVPGAVRGAALDIARFSGWLTLTFFLTSVMGRLDFFYLYRIRGGEEAGVYAAAIQLSLALTMFIGSFTTVLTPYVSERTTYEAKVALLRRLMPAVAGLGALLVASSVTFPFVIELLFGAKYQDAAGPLTVLVIHLALNIVLIPISLMLIPLGQVRIGTAISVLQLGSSLVLYPVLIRAHGATGAALTVLVNTSLAVVIYPLVLRWLLRRERAAEHAAAALGSSP